MNSYLESRKIFFSILLMFSTSAFAEADGGPIVILAIISLQFLIFTFSLWVVYRLWKAVLSFLDKNNMHKSSLLNSIIGRVDMDSSNKEIKVKAVSTGLGGTILIIALAVVAMHVIGNHSVTGQ